MRQAIAVSGGILGGLLLLASGCSEPSATPRATASGEAGLPASAAVNSPSVVSGETGSAADQKLTPTPAPLSGTTSSSPSNSAGNSLPSGTSLPGEDPIADVASHVRFPAEGQTTPQGSVSDAGTAVRSLPPLTAATVAAVPLGQTKGNSMLEGVESPDRVKDEEADAVTRGRRLVGEIVFEFGGGHKSAEELARAILGAVHKNDSKALHDLAMTQREFATICWPEFPQSRPVTNIKAEDAWFFHSGSCHDGINELLNAYGGRELSLLGLRATKGRMDYANFDLYDGVILEAIDDHGEKVSIPWVLTLVERNGTWKVYIYKD